MLGTGYVGLVSGVCFADIGNQVICVDKDKTKIKLLNSGIIPIYEPGLEEIVKRNHNKKRLIFTTDLKEAIKNSKIIFICVGTPTQKNSNKADLKYVFQVTNQLKKYINNYKIIVTKSTVPVTTGDKIESILKKNKQKSKYDVVSNPEFLREGTAVEDFFKPDRIVIGGNDSSKVQKLKDLYSDFEAEIIITDPVSSQLIKYLANTYLPMRLSFVNEAARLVNSSGGNLDDVLKGVGMDSRIGQHYFRPSPAWGGSCFPKDVVEVNNFYDSEEVNLPLIANIIESNKIQTQWTAKMLKSIHNEKNLSGIILV